MAEEKKTLQNASQDELLIARKRAALENNYKAVKDIEAALAQRFDWVSTPEQTAPESDAAQSGQSPYVDYLKSLGSGLYQGAVGMVDLPAQVGELAARGVEKGYEKVTGEQPSEAFSTGLRSAEFPVGGSMFAQRGKEFAEEYTPSAYGYEPTTEEGKTIQRVGNFLVFAGRRPFTQGVAPAVASEKVKEARGVKGTNLEVPLEIATAVLTPVITKRIISPTGGKLTGETKKALDVLAKEGVFPTAAQSTGSRQAAFVEQSVEAGLDLIEKAQNNFNRAALRRIGVNAEKATTDVMDEAYNRIGSNLNSTIGNVTGAATRQDVKDIADILKVYSGQVGPTQSAPIFTTLYQSFLQSARSGQNLSNSEIRTFHQTLNGLTRRGDETGRAARDVINVVNSFISKNLGAEGSAAWKQANKEYRDFLAIEDALSKAGGVAGDVTPQALRASAKTVFGKRGFVLGRSDLAELAKAGSLALKPLPSSGTAERIAAAGGPAGAGLTSGGLAQAFGLSPELVGGAVAAGAYAPKAYASAVTSPMGQAYLRNQLIGNLDEGALMRYLAATSVQ